MANDANIKWRENKKKETFSLTLPVMERIKSADDLDVAQWEEEKEKKTKPDDIIIEPFSGRNDDVATNANSNAKKKINL